ncbi:MAG: Uncharacterised protein [Chloroflexota bacterium]|nr:MAG: Uncharacterised protein [Chloroflexota bacterium]
MAEAYKKSHTNANPPIYGGKGSGLRIIRRHTIDDGTVTGSNPPVPLHNKNREGLVKHSFNEVGSGLKRDSFGNNQSSTIVSEFPPDHNGQRYLMSNSEREPLWQRFNFPVMNQEEGGIDGNNYTYSQYNKTTSNNDIVPQYDRWIKPETGYDEQYFQHIFNWPLAHTLIERKCSAFIKESGNTNPVPPATNTLTTAVHGIDWLFGESSDNATMNLDKVDSDIGYTTVNSDGDWVYNSITVNADGTLPETAQKKIGHPVLYHGGTDTPALFFNYHVTAPTPSRNLVVNGDFSQNTGNLVTPQWNVTGSPGTITKVTISGDPQCRFAQPNDSTWMQMTQDITTEIGREYEVTFTLGTCTATNPNWSIHIDSATPDPYVSTHRQHIWGYQNNGADPISGNIQNPNKTYKGKFIATVTNTRLFIRNGADDNVVSHIDDIEVRAINTGTSGTANVVAPGDTIIAENGSSVTINKVVNYIVDVALKRIVYKHSKKNTLPAKLKINSLDGISVGDKVIGAGIRPDTTIKQINFSKKEITLSLSLKSKKIKDVKILNGGENQVNANTLCYMTLNSPQTSQDFDADDLYQVQRGGVNQFQVRVRAGWNVKHRSAICGVYYTEGKKELEYNPMFYSSDPHCTKSVTEDSNGRYTLGTVVWDDSTRLENVLLLTYPKTEAAYKIASMYMAFTKAPIEKDLFETFLAEYNQNLSVIGIYGSINAYATTTMAGKKAVSVTDEVCRDEITLDYTQNYDAFQEAADINTAVSESTASIGDTCLDLGEDNPDTIDGVQERFKEMIRDSISNSSFLPKEYYKQLVSNDNSIYNKISTAGDALQNTQVKSKNIEKIPSILEGEDSSGVNWTTSNYRSLPPAMDRIRYLITDMQTGSDDDLNPLLDLNPATTKNQPRLVIRSVPRWMWQNQKQTGIITVTKDCNFTGGGVAEVEIKIKKDSEGYLEEITAESGSDQDSKTGISPLDPGIDVSNVTAPVSPATKSFVWVEPKADSTLDTALDNRYWDVRPSSTKTLQYLNLGLPPEERDLQYDHFNQNVYPTRYDGPKAGVDVYPEVLWKSNINYQTDYYKMFEYRINESAQQIVECIQNGGNPYIDDPVRAKLSKTLGSTDTTIEVASTVGFLSSGYLIIPKYIKKVYTQETGNSEPYFTYCGEEIIFYKSKTATSFTECERARFGTTALFENIINATEIELGVRYKIATLGFTDWSLLEIPDPEVGTIFTAQKDLIVQEHVLGSNYFDGTDDYMIIPETSPFMMSSTQNWTFECWVKVESGAINSKGCQILGTHEWGTNSDFIFSVNPTGKFEAYFQQNHPTVNSQHITTESVPLDEWVHLAAVRNGTGANNLTLYINGVGQSFTNSKPFSNGSNLPVSIGADQNGDECIFKGYISNIRFVEDNAIYTSNFTPPTSPLTAVPGTVLLCCKENDPTAFDVSPSDITNNNVGGGFRGGINHNPFFDNITTENGHGTVEVFGSNQEATPDATLIPGLEADPKIPVLSSYNRGFSVAQFPIFKIQE